MKMTVVQKGDYIGLGLLSPLDSRWLPEISLHFMLEDIELIAHGLVVEVSSDGYNWVLPLPDSDLALPLPICKLTRIASTAPDYSFPTTFLSSSSALDKIYEQKSLESSSALGRWWRRRNKSQRKIRECVAVVSTALEPEEEIEEGVGWRFIRLKSEENVEGVGWGVYELWLS